MEKSLDELLNEATAISEERQQKIKENAVKTANELFKEITIKKDEQ